MNEKEKAFSSFINGLNLRHFRGSEFIYQARRENSGGLSGIPPKSKWKNIVPTLQVLDQLRAHLGSSVSLTSTYRSAGYNRACGGASQSQHKEFSACDIQVKGVKPRIVYEILITWRRAGVFKGGLGLYNTFVHIDTRGNNATWG
jgi:hypothetical protein